MIYVLGVNEHRYQAVNPTINPDESKFCEFVLKHVRTKKIGRVAEEMNDEFLQRENGSQESVCRKLANARGIAHSMCEPNTSERQQIGYIDKLWEQFAIEDQTGCNEKINAAHSAFHKKQWHIRENFWLEKLRPHVSDNVLFVCGASHASRFSKLLKSKGIKNRIICKRWKP
jgi:hypothetical protein